jgi:hypothetical protein
MLVVGEFSTGEMGNFQPALTQALPDSEAKVIKGLKEAALTRLASDAPTPGKGERMPVATYKFSRLCFKRDLIEGLGPNDSFRVEDPIGHVGRWCSGGAAEERHRFRVLQGVALFSDVIFFRRYGEMPNSPHLAKCSYS